MSADGGEVERLREAGAWQEAADAAFRMVQAAPDHGEPWAQLGLILPQLGRIDEAERAAERSLALVGDHPLGLRAMALIKLRRQDLAAAAVLAERACQKAPDSAPTITALAAVRLAQRRLADAEVLLARAAAIAPLAEIDANRALLELSRNDMAAAIRHAERAVAKKPHLANVWRMLAALYVRAGQDDKAIDAFEKVVKLQAADVAVLVDLGGLYNRANRVADAIAALERAVTLAPDVPACWLNYAIALRAAGRIPQALEAFEKAAMLTTLEESVHVAMAQLYDKINRLEDAEASYRKALDIRSDVMTARALMWIHRRMGKMSEALEFLGKDTGFVRFAASGGFRVIVE